MARLGRIPTVGDFVDIAGYRLEVNEVNSRRVTMVQLTPERPG